MLAAGLACVGALASGCARSATAPADPSRGFAAAEAFSDAPGALWRYRSRRLSASLPLPDGPGWRIDDHSRPELLATHALTRSRVVLAVFHADGLVGRTQCEAAARARHQVPDGDLRTLEDRVTVVARTFDTRVWVAVAPGAGPDRALSGHVMAFGGSLRKCFVFVFSTEVDGAADETVLSARLAFARERILGGLTLDAFDAVEREGADPP